MTAPLLALAGIILLIILALRERRSQHSIQIHTEQPDWRAREYLGGGHWRDYYAPFDGRDLDDHERNHYEQAMLARAAELLELRTSGRMTGRQVIVAWHPGRDPQADDNAACIQRHGARYGVHVRQS